jgi:4-amino-4-deoxy-L-arabinose transferase-like glycosyltransferase
MTAALPPLDERFRSWLVAGGIAIAALWLVMSMTYPLGWDQGLFAWMGNAIVDGGLPYRDAWDFKGPLLYYVYALAQWLFGVHLWSIRLVDAALLIIGTAGVHRTAAVLADARSARFGAVLFALWYASHSFWHTAQPDGWTGMLVMLAVAALAARESSPTFGKTATAGICLGLTVLMKPLWAALLVPPVLYLALSSATDRAKLILALFAGWALPLAVALAWFASQGALADVVDVHLRYSALYAGLASDNRLRGLAEYFLASRVMALAAPIAAYGLVVLWRTRRPTAVLLATWLAITVFLVVLQGRFYAYHWLPMLPAMAVLVTVGLCDLFDRARSFELILSIALILGCVAPICLEEARFVAWRFGAIDRQEYYNAFGEPGFDMQAVDWLRTTGAPGKIFTFGWHCAVPWLSERQSVSRFGYSLPLMMADETSVRSSYREELIAALTADPPKYIVVGTLSEQILGTRLTIADFPEFAELVEHRYRPVAQFGTIAIYEIRP